MESVANKRKIERDRKRVYRRKKKQFKNTILTLSELSSEDSVTEDELDVEPSWNFSGPSDYENQEFPEEDLWQQLSEGEQDKEIQTETDPRHEEQNPTGSEDEYSSDEESEYNDRPAVDEPYMDEAFLEEEDEAEIQEEFEEYLRYKNPNNSFKSKLPVYEGCKLTVLQSCIALLALFFRCKLSLQTFRLFLATIALHLPQENNFFKSLYILKKFLPCNAEYVKKNSYCKKCFKIIGIDNCNCPDRILGKFLTFSISQQIKVLFNRHAFRLALSHRFNRIKKVDGNIEDIYDGLIYKSLIESGFLNNINNISFSWYTDGVPLFKSSKYSVWPLFFIINELPYSIRYLPQNVVFAGLWYGSGKPNVNTFILPLHDELVTLQDTGISVKLRTEGNLVINVRAKILCGSCDLPARAMVLNMIQFNGAYGCHKCLTKGEAFKEKEVDNADDNNENERTENNHGTNDSEVAKLKKKGKRGAWVYPYPEKIVLRTLNATLKNSLKALSSGALIHGLKGPTLLFKLVPNIITCTGIDVMHCVFSGVTKRMMCMLLDPKLSKHEFSLSKFATQIDKRIDQIKPPSFVKRLPRSFKINMAYLKSAEFKMWLLYYSIPVLLDLLPEPYLSHYISLIQAIFLLSSESISPADIVRAKKILKIFVKKYEELYGTQFMTINLHSLIHLADTVKELGPLWVTSCFPLEDLNGKMTRFVHGTRCAETQIWQSFTALQSLPLLQNEAEDNIALQDFLRELKSTNQYTINHEIEPHLFVVGRFKRLDIISPNIRDSLIDASIVFTKCWIFYRLKKETLLYVSRSYSQNIRTVSYCVNYRCNRGNIETGLINCFVTVKSCECLTLCECLSKYFAIIERCEMLEIPLRNSDFIREIIVTNTFIAVDVRNLININYFITVEKKNYCIKPVKSFEFE